MKVDSFYKRLYLIIEDLFQGNLIVHFSLNPLSINHIEYPIPLKRREFFGPKWIP